MQRTADAGFENDRPQNTEDRPTVEVGADGKLKDLWIIVSLYPIYNCYCFITLDFTATNIILINDITRYFQ